MQKLRELTPQEQAIEDAKAIQYNRNESMKQKVVDGLKQVICSLKFPLETIPEGKLPDNFYLWAKRTLLYDNLEYSGYGFLTCGWLQAKVIQHRCINNECAELTINQMGIILLSISKRTPWELSEQNMSEDEIFANNAIIKEEIFKLHVCHKVLVDSICQKIEEEINPKKKNKQIVLGK